MTIFTKNSHTSNYIRPTFFKEGPEFSLERSSGIVYNPARFNTRKWGVAKQHLFLQIRGIYCSYFIHGHSGDSRAPLNVSSDGSFDDCPALRLRATQPKTKFCDFRSKIVLQNPDSGSRISTDNYGPSLTRSQRTPLRYSNRRKTRRAGDLKEVAQCYM